MTNDYYWQQGDWSATSGEINHIYPEDLRKLSFLIWRPEASVEIADDFETGRDWLGTMMTWDMAADTGDAINTNFYWEPGWFDNRTARVVWHEESYDGEIVDYDETENTITISEDQSNCDKSATFTHVGGGTTITAPGGPDIFRDNSPLLICNNSVDKGFFRVKNREVINGDTKLTLYLPTELVECLLTVSDVLGGEAKPLSDWSAKCDFGGDLYCTERNFHNESGQQDAVLDWPRLSDYDPGTDEYAEVQTKVVDAGIVNTKHRPPAGGLQSWDNTGWWTRCPNPYRYHHFDVNSHRKVIYFFIETDDYGCYKAYYKKEYDSCEFLPQQTDPKEQVVPTRDVDNVIWDYNHKVPLRALQLTDPSRLGPRRNVETVTLDSGIFVDPYQYSNHRYSNGSKGENEESGNPPNTLNTWPGFEGFLPMMTADYSTGDFYNQSLLRVKGGGLPLQNYFEWICDTNTFSSLQWCFKSDDSDPTAADLQDNWLIEYSFMRNQDDPSPSGAEFDASTNLTGVHTYPDCSPDWNPKDYCEKPGVYKGTIPPDGDPGTQQTNYKATSRFWGCNGSTIELLLKRSGDYSWWLDTTNPYQPETMLFERAKWNSHSLPTVYGTWRRTWKYTLGRPMNGNTPAIMTTLPEGSLPTSTMGERLVVNGSSSTGASAEGQNNDYASVVMFSPYLTLNDYNSMALADLGYTDKEVTGIDNTNFSISEVSLGLRPGMVIYLSTTATGTMATSMLFYINKVEETETDTNITVSETMPAVPAYIFYHTTLSDRHDGEIVEGSDTISYARGLEMLSHIWDVMVQLDTLRYETQTDDHNGVSLYPGMGDGAYLLDPPHNMGALSALAWQNVDKGQELMDQEHIDEGTIKDWGVTGDNYHAREFVVKDKPGDQISLTGSGSIVEDYNTSGELTSTTSSASLNSHTGYQRVKESNITNGFMDRYSSKIIRSSGRVQVDFKIRPHIGTGVWPSSFIKWPEIYNATYWHKYIGHDAVDDPAGPRDYLVRSFVQVPKKSGGYTSYNSGERSNTTKDEHDEVLKNAICQADGETVVTIPPAERFLAVVTGANIADPYASIENVIPYDTPEDEPNSNNDPEGYEGYAIGNPNAPDDAEVLSCSVNGSELTLTITGCHFNKMGRYVSGTWFWNPIKLQLRQGGTGVSTENYYYYFYFTPMTPTSWSYNNTTDKMTLTGNLPAIYDADEDGEFVACYWYDARNPWRQYTFDTPMFVGPYEGGGYTWYTHKLSISNRDYLVKFREYDVMAFADWSCQALRLDKHEEYYNLISDIQYDTTLSWIYTFGVFDWNLFDSPIFDRDETRRILHTDASDDNNAPSPVAFFSEPSMELHVRDKKVVIPLSDVTGGYECDSFLSMSMPTGETWKITGIAKSGPGIDNHYITVTDVSSTKITVSGIRPSLDYSIYDYVIDSDDVEYSIEMVAEIAEDAENNGVQYKFTGDELFNEGYSSAYKDDVHYSAFYDTGYGYDPENTEFPGDWTLSVRDTKGNEDSCSYTMID